GFCIFDRDGLQSRRGQLQRVSLPIRIVAPPNVRARLGFDLLSQSRGDQLRCDLLGCGALQTRRSNNAAVFALRGGAQHDELRVGEFDGHGLTLRLWEHGQSGPSPGRAPDRCDRRGEGVSGGHTRPADVHIHALFRRKRQSFCAHWRSHLEERKSSCTYDAEYLRSSKNGTQLDFTSDGAKATFFRNLTRGRVIVHETDGRVISIDLKKD